VMESEKLQGAGHSFRKCWSLLSFNQGIVSFINW
jgi:hypothetical protein